MDPNRIFDLTSGIRAASHGSKGEAAGHCSHQATKWLSQSETRHMCRRAVVIPACAIKALPRSRGPTNPA